MLLVELYVRTSLAAGLVSAFFYGIFVVLFITSTYFLILRRIRSSVKHRISLKTFVTPTICFNILMFLTVTGSCLLACIRVFEAFLIFNGGTTPGVFYADPSRITMVVESPFLVLSVAIADVLIMYRLWVVWDNNYYVTFFPLLGTLGLMTCTIGLTYQLSISGHDALQVDSPFGRWFMTACICTLSTNLYCTSFIIWRIWRINRAAQNYGDRNLASLVVVLVESAAVFTLWILFLLIIYQVQESFVPMADTVAIVSGIASMLINVRVGMGSAWANNSIPTIRTSPLALQLEREPGSDDGIHTAQMAPLVISITTHTEQTSLKEPQGSGILPQMTPSHFRCPV